jgi:hypothetical protein
VEPDFEVGGRFVECSVSSRGDYPGVLSVVRSRVRKLCIHFWLCHASLSICLLSRGETSH